MTAGDLRKNKISDAAGHPAEISRTAQDARRQRTWARILALVLAVTFTMSAKAQTQATPPAQAQTQSSSQTSTPAGDGSTEKIAGNYAVQQSIEFGYRDSMIDGNVNNYNTFVNLSSGMRLFDYTLNMRSIDHQGLFFDNLSFSSSGYGGDPNDVSRLHVDKNKWYDFRATFRRDKDAWNYNLLANPLNPSKGPINGVAIANSPHALDLSRRMQDYDLTLLPQSRVRIRLGYSRNVNTGPASTTLEGGTDTALLQSVSEITNAYRMGVDYRGLPGTTLSFDETLIRSAVNNSATDNNLIYQLSNGTPVDLGIVFVGTTPCANPITNAATAPPTVTANCNGYLSYSQFQNPRSSFPTERFSFQSTYFRNLAMSGSASYSSGDNTVSGFNDAVNGWTTRTLTRGSTTGGPAQAKRVSVNTNWSGDYRVTDKLSIFDEFSYENWRIPSMWATADTNLFATPAQAGQSGLLLPIATVTPATFATICPTAPYNGPNCPQHNASSLVDATDELVSQFLGQNIRSNTIELKYDFTRRVNAYVGYEYTARTIADFSATWDTGEIYLPGGVGGKPGILQGAPPAAGGNYYFAARGDCAVIAATGALPAACTYNPANGSIQEGSSANLVPDTGNDIARNLYDIHENAGLIGVSARPIDTLRLNADLMFGYNDNSFTRTSPRQLQSYKLRANYTPRPWASLGATVDIHENRNNVAMVNNIEHGRTYSLVATLSPKSNLYVDVGYNYMDIYTQTEICFPATGSAIFTTPCPIAGATSPLGTLSFYSSRDNYAYADVMWKPYKRVTAMAGYGGSIVRGDTTFLNPLTPTGTLDFNYVKPFASLAFDIYRGVIYKTAWNYYGYNDHGVANPPGLAALPSQNFNGSNVTFSFRYSF
jgi:hypothetical protein